MKLLIIAGPYEADRIRRAAVQSGFEAVAVEPGESLSGWITATRPDVIVLAPQIVSPDLDTALGKVRAVPRGRVPIFLVGDEEHRESLRDQADGFFVRPVALEELFARARDVLARTAPGAGDDPASGPHSPSGSGPHAKATGIAAEDSARVRAFSASEGTPTRTPTLKPLVAARDSAALVAGTAARDSAEPSTRAQIPVLRPAPARKTSEAWPAPAPAPSFSGQASALSGVRRESAPSMFATLAEDIAADFDAELRDVVRTLGVLREAKAATALATGTVPPPANPHQATDQDALAELKDEFSQKTLEVPSRVSADLIETERGPDGTAALSRDAKADRDFVLARQATVMDGDYFQILGLSRDATAADVEYAREQLLAALAPEALSPSVVTELEDELAEIRAVVAEAARLLLNDALRGRYQRHLPSLDVPQ